MIELKQVRSFDRMSFFEHFDRVGQILIGIKSETLEAQCSLGIEVTSASFYHICLRWANYEAGSLRCDEITSANHMKSLVNRDHLGFPQSSRGGGAGGR